MDLSRIRNGNLVMAIVPIDFVPIATGVAQRYTESLGEHHLITTQVPAQSVKVAGDAGRLEQILDNLLSNAFKYSPAGGEINAELVQVVDGTVLSVRDAGIGLSPDGLEHVF